MSEFEALAANIAAMRGARYLGYGREDASSLTAAALAQKRSAVLARAALVPKGPISDQTEPAAVATLLKTEVDAVASWAVRRRAIYGAKRVENQFATAIHEGAQLLRRSTSRS